MTMITNRTTATMTRIAPPALSLLPRSRFGSDHDPLLPRPLTRRPPPEPPPAGTSPDAEDIAGTPHDGPADPVRERHHLEERVRHQRGGPGDDRHELVIAGVTVADVRELVRDDALQLLTCQRRQQPGGHGDRRMLGVAAGREGVGCGVVDEIEARRRQVRGERELVHDVPQLRLLAVGQRARARRRQHDRVAARVRDHGTDDARHDDEQHGQQPDARAQRDDGEQDVRGGGRAADERDGQEEGVAIVRGDLVTERGLATAEARQHDRHEHGTRRDRDQDDQRRPGRDPPRAVDEGEWERASLGDVEGKQPDERDGEQGDADDHAPDALPEAPVHGADDALVGSPACHVWSCPRLVTRVELIPTIWEPFGLTLHICSMRDQPGRDVVGGPMHRDLVERAMAGDREAFTELTRRSIGRLYAIARLILRDTERAEDATQEALVAAWKQLSALRDPDRFDAWLRRLLVRACYREAARDQHQRRIVAQIRPIEMGMPDPGIALADRDQLERGFSRLSPEQRALVVLHYYLELPMHETAEILGLPIGTVKSRLFRTTQQLRAALEADARLPLAERGQA